MKNYKINSEESTIILQALKTYRAVIWDDLKNIDPAGSNAEKITYKIFREVLEKTEKIIEKFD